MSFSPARSQPESDSMSMSPSSDIVTDVQSCVQSTKWPPSPEISISTSTSISASAVAAAEIVAEAKAKMAMWSSHLVEDKDYSSTQPVPVPPKTKFVPTKSSPKFDPRQAALNKLAAKRIALAKSKAKAGVKPSIKIQFSGKSSHTSLTTSTAPLRNEKEAVGSSSIQISLSLSTHTSSSAVAAVDKQASSVTTMPSSSAINALSNISANNNMSDMGPSMLDPNSASNRPTSVQLQQAMQATLQSESFDRQLANSNICLSDYFNKTSGMSTRLLNMLTLS